MTAPSRIVVVNLENQDFDSTIGDTAEAPFLNQLVSEGMQFTNYISLTHPSQSNYLALFSGSTQGVADNTVPSEFSNTVSTLASTPAPQGLTISGAVQGPLTLTSADNPLLITATGSVTSTVVGADAIDGGAGVDWSITNAGNVSSSQGYGINLAGQGTISNSGSISGTGAVVLSEDGSVTNSGTITATGLLPAPLATISAIYVTGPSGGGINAIGVTNQGVVTAADGYGIGLGASGTVLNSGQVTGGEDGVVVVSGVGDIENSGSIVATLDDGVGLFGGGTVTNDVGGSISGAVVATLGAAPAGIFITGGTGTITNSGGISGLDYGVLIAAGGGITNNALATISGQTAGVSLSHGGTVSNGGTIEATGTGGAGADLELGGSVTNNSGGTVSGVAYGIFITGTLGTVVNAGQVSASTFSGVSLGAGGSVQNDLGGVIDGETAGVTLNNGGSITNDGSIGANGTGGAGASLALGGTVTNDSTGAISGDTDGIFVTGSQGTVTNSGQITGLGFSGVALGAGGTVQNESGGAIKGQTAGVSLSNGGGITNDGSIGASGAGGAGADLEQGGSVTNDSGGTITGAYGVFVAGSQGAIINSGQISGTTYSGVSLGVGGSVQNNTGGAILGETKGVGLSNGGSITNSGSIEALGSGAAGAELDQGGSVTNNSGGTISGAYGIFVGGAAGTVTNAGTISGTIYAVDFSTNSSANRLVDDPGAVFNGVVNGGGSGVLELASDAGSISGIGGASLYGFQILDADTGANWTLSGANTIATVTNNGALDIAGSVDVTAAIDSASTGVFDLSASGSLEVAQALGSQAAMNFQGASELLVDNGALFGTGVGTASYQGAQLENFGSGDSVDLRNFSAVGVTQSYNAASGLLQISNGANQKATFDFQNSTLGLGTFVIGTDGSSGVLITLIGTGANIAATAAIISANLDSYEANLPASIAVTDNGPLTVTVGQITSDAAALAVTSNADGSAYALLVNDLAANVSATFDALGGNTHVTSIVLTDSGTPVLTLSVAQALGDTTALNEISGTYTITISDTAANVAANLDALNADAHVTSIALTDPPTPTLGLTAAQYANDTKALGEITTPYTIVISGTGAVAAKAAVISANLDSYQASVPSSITVTDNRPLTVTVGQITSDATALSLTSNADGSAYSLVVKDSGAHVSAAFDALNGNTHVTSIVLTDSGSLTLSVAQALGDTMALAEITPPYAITISDMAANVAAFVGALNANSQVTLITISDTAANVAANLDALNGSSHVTSIALTDNGVPALTLSVAQALGDTTALSDIATPYTITISDTAANVAARFDALNGDSQVTSIVLTDAGIPTLTLTAAQYANDTKALGEITTPYSIVISNTGAIVAKAAAISANLNSYEASLPSSITVTDNKPLTVTVGQITSDAAALALTSNADGSAYTLLVKDSAANVSAAFDALNGNTHVTSIVLTDSGTPALTLSVAQALGDTAALAEITSAYTITISDTAANVATAIDVLNADSEVTSLSLTGGGALTLSVAQALNDTTALSEITTSYTITISDTAADVAANLDALNADTHVTSIVLTDVSKPTLTLSIQEALNDTRALGEITSPHATALADTAADIELITSAQAATLKADGYTSIAATTGPVLMTIAEATYLSSDGIAVTGAPVVIQDTAAHIRAMTIAQINALALSHVTQITASNATVLLSPLQVAALENAGVTVSAPPGDTVLISGTAANLERLTATQISGLTAVGATGLVSTNANVSYTSDQTAAILSSRLSVSASGSHTVTENFANGDYSVYQGGQLIRQKSVNPDGSYDIAYFNVAGQTSEAIYNSAKVYVATAQDNANGSGNLLVYANGLTITTLSGSESVTVGSDTFALVPHSVETTTIERTKTNTLRSKETFVFGPGFGQDTIAGFLTTTASHDLLQFSASMFGFSSTSSQTADAQALLNSFATGTTNTTITDLQGDSLTLNGVTIATLKAHLADFKFT